MNLKLVLAQVTLCASLAALTGCNKEQPAQSTETGKPAEGLASEASKGVEQVKAQASQATEAVTAEVKAAQEKAQGLIANAKSLLEQNKPQEALASLTQLSGLQLTDEQKNAVEDLKAKIQAALAKATSGDAASALRNTLGEK